MALARERNTEQTRAKKGLTEKTGRSCHPSYFASMARKSQTHKSSDYVNESDEDTIKIMSTKRYSSSSSSSTIAAAFGVLATTASTVNLTQ
jgi:hypothetical protein